MRCSLSSRGTFNSLFHLRVRTRTTDEIVFISRFRGSQENLLYWSAQIMAILKAKYVWQVVRADDAVSLSLSYQVQARVKGSDVIGYPEYAKNAACSIIL